MRKRVFILLGCLTFVLSMLVWRIGTINKTIYSDAGYTQGARIINVGETRGMIYDRYANPLVNRQEHKLLVINPTADAANILKENLSYDEYEEIKDSLSSGEPFTAICDSYTGKCDDILEFVSFDRYSESDRAVHVIGYTDAENNGVCGIEKSFDELMKQNSGTLSVRYFSSSTGTALSGKGFEIINDNYASAGGIVLTVDSRMQRICEDAMSRNNIEKGAVVVLDAQTSEILAFASAPVYDRFDLSSSLENENLPFINRALSAYPVGSVFKPVVAAAALEKNISAETVFDCRGYVTLSGNKFNCHNKSGHGKNDMTAAMAVSCNSYFIELGQLVGAESIIMTASNLGLGKEIELCDSLVSVSGNLPDANEMDSDAALANLSFGQGSLLATPLQIAALYCAFANGGYYREPYILKSIIDSDGNEVLYYKNEINNKVITDSVCKKIRIMLKETVDTGSGKLANPMGITAAGKTATAQTGMTDENGSVVNTWFAGYYPAEEPEYVIVVFKEDGDSSSTDCAPVFRDIADAF